MDIKYDNPGSTLGLNWPTVYLIKDRFYITVLYDYYITISKSVLCTLYVEYIHKDHIDK